MGTKKSRTNCGTQALFLFMPGLHASFNALWPAQGTIAECCGYDQQSEQAGFPELCIPADVEFPDHERVEVPAGGRAAQAENARPAGGNLTPGQLPVIMTLLIQFSGLYYLHIGGLNSAITIAGFFESPYRPEVNQPFD
jgi:hypothetical protein